MNWDSDIFTPNMCYDMDLIRERAWSIYCFETRGAMSAKDFWWELSKQEQERFISKAFDEISETGNFG